MKVLPIMIEKAWQEYERYSNNGAAWNAYRNRLCVEGFINWLQEVELGSPMHQPKAWPNESELPNFWEVIEGAAIQWGETTLVLMPIVAEELKTFAVPRDWVDIWPADYYVAVKMHLDEDEENNWMQVWGYTTHRELKRKGQYNKEDGVYCLDVEVLIPDITHMLLARQLLSSRKDPVPQIPPLTQKRAVGLLEKLSKPDVHYPRLAVSFEEWGGLMLDPVWRQQLYQMRLAQVQDRVSVPSVATGKSPVNLRKWFDGIIEAGWQTIEEMIESSGTQELNLAYGLAGAAARFRDVATTIKGNTSQEAVPTLIKLLENRRDLFDRVNAVHLLGSIAQGNQEAIAALTKLVNTDPNAEMRRIAAVNLNKIDPKNPQGGVRGGKVIDLGMVLGDRQVALVIILMPEGNQKTNVILQMSPFKGHNYLPPNLQMLVFNDRSETILSTESGSADNAVQLELVGDRGDYFNVKVALGDASITEYFVL